MGSRGWCGEGGKGVVGRPNKKKRGPKNHKSRGWVTLHIGAKFLKNKKRKKSHRCCTGFLGVPGLIFFQSGLVTSPNPAPPHPHAVHTPCLLRHSMLCMCMSVLCVGGVGQKVVRGSGQGGLGTPKQKKIIPPQKKSHGPGVVECAAFSPYLYVPKTNWRSDFFCRFQNGFLSHRCCTGFLGDPV